MYSIINTRKEVNVLKKSNQYKATVTLAVVTLGFLISYPFHATFIGGLLESLFSAAMIGGLADWFAISALFRKPLGIPWRTEIIPRNRDKIFNTIIDMAENELLTKDNLKKKLDNYNISDLLVKYLTEHGGDKNIKNVLNRIVQDILENINPEDTGKFLENLLKNNVVKIKLSPLIAEVVEWSLKNGYDEKVINFFLSELIRIAGQRQMKIQIESLYHNVRTYYEQGMIRRKIVNDLLICFMLRIPPDVVADFLQQELLKFLNDLKTPSHTWRKKLKIRIQNMVLGLKTDDDLIKKLEDWKVRQIEQNFSIQHTITVFVKAFIEASATSQGEVLAWSNLTDIQIDKLVKDFMNDQTKLQKVDIFIKTAINKWIDKQHNQIGRIIKESLDQFTGDMLIEFVETRAGNDLQMIRINGSVVGGLVGMVIFLLTFWII